MFLRVCAYVWSTHSAPCERYYELFFDKKDTEILKILVFLLLRRHDSPFLAGCVKKQKLVQIASASHFYNFYKMWSVKVFNYKYFGITSQVHKNEVPKGVLTGWQLIIRTPKNLSVWQIQKFYTYQMKALFISFQTKSITFWYLSYS